MMISPVLGIALRGILLLSSVFLIGQSYLFLADYLQYRAEIDVRIKQEIAPFPTVTVCADLGDNSQFSDRDVPINAAPVPVQLRDFVFSGAFNREVLSIPASAQDFREFLDVDYYGHCFSYNWNTSSGLRTAKPGPKNGLRLMLNTSGSTNTRRIRIVVHERGVAPAPLQSGLTAATGHVTSVGYKQRHIRRLNDPYGFCRAEDHSMRFKYSQQKCRSDCINNKVFLACGCAFPPNPLIKLNPHQCNTTEQRSCFDRELRSGENDHSNCNCAPDCEETVYETTYSTSLLPSTVSACFSSKSEKECTDYNSSKIAIIDVYPSQNNYEMLVERPVYSLSHLLTDVARNGILLLLIMIMAVMLPARVKEKKDQTSYEKTPLTSS